MSTPWLTPSPEPIEVFHTALERSRRRREAANALRARILAASQPHLRVIADVIAAAKKAGVEVAMEHGPAYEGLVNLNENVHCTSPSGIGSDYRHTVSGYRHTVTLTGDFPFQWEFHYALGFKLLHIHVPLPHGYEKWKDKMFTAMTLTEIQEALPVFIAFSLGEIAGRIAADRTTPTA